MISKTRKIFAIVALLLFGGLFIHLGSKELINSKRLAARGLTTTGQVLETEDHVSGRLRWHTYYVRVRFQPERGDPVEKSVRVSESVYLAAQAASSIKVYYLAEDPTICTAGDTVEIRYANLVWGGGFFFAAGYLIVFFKQPASKQELVESVEHSLKPLTETTHDWIEVDAKKFPHLDRKFYDDGRGYLESLGFRFLGDLQNVTLLKHGGARTFVRNLASRDGDILAALYHFKPRLMLRVLGAREVKVMDLETWFSNHTFVCTSNAEAAGKLDYPPEIDSAFLPAGTSRELVMEAHRKRVAAYRQKNPDLDVIKIRELPHVYRAQEELQRIKAEFRRQRGLTKPELERIAGMKSAEVDDLAATLARRRDRPDQ